MSEKKMSRRNFLKTAGIATAAVGVALCGGGAAASTIRKKPEELVTSIDNPDTTHRVLITYATRSGTTSGIAQRIADRLGQKALDIDLKAIEDVTDITSYDTVLVGSGIRMGRYMSAAMKFIEENANILAMKNFGTFFACMTLVPDNEETRKEADAYFVPIRQIVSPQFEGAFAGAYIPQYLTLTDRLIMKVLKIEEGDFRDWNAIDTWADSVAAEIV